MNLRYQPPAFIGSVTLEKRNYQIAHTLCPSCNREVYITGYAGLREQPVLYWDAFFLIADQDRGRPSGTPHSCPPSAFVV